jgi:hypothetical protein
VSCGIALLARRMVQTSGSNGMIQAAFAIPVSSQLLPAKTPTPSKTVVGILASSRPGSTTPKPKVERLSISRLKLAEPMEQALDSRLGTSTLTSPCGCTKISRPALAPASNARSSGSGTSTMQSLKKMVPRWSHMSGYIRTMIAGPSSVNIQEVKPIPSDGLSQIASTSLFPMTAKQGFGMLLVVLRVNGLIPALSPTVRTGSTEPTNLHWTRLSVNLRNVKRDMELGMVEIII